MSDELERQPEQADAEPEICLELTESEVEEPPQEAASWASRAECLISLCRETLSQTAERIKSMIALDAMPLRSRLRSFGAAILGVTAIAAVAIALAQGLTAGLLSSWPAKIVGNTETTTSLVGLSVDTRNGQTEGGGELRIARIQDLAQGSEDGQIEITTDKDGGAYLPPGSRQNQADPGVIITVPASQGRLLRFDEPVESVFIADPSIADIKVVSPNVVYVYGKTLGHTNLLAISNGTGGAGGQGTGRAKLTGSALLRVVTDLGPAYDAKRAFAPEAPVDLFIFGRRAAVKGRVTSIDQAVDIANLADTYSPSDQPPINSSTLDGSNQINIRVRFAEVSRDDLKSFGIDWNVNVTAGSFNFGLQKTSSTGFGLNPNIELNTSAGNFDIDLFIEALQANGALNLLAEPNLTAVTGETASFLAGGEVPVPVPTGRDRDTITIEYKQFGVSLLFTPTLVKNNRIAMRVRPEVSSITSTSTFSVQGFALPVFSVRRAETAVEVASGQTFALAGLFQRDIQRNVEKLPFLGDVPVLGKLFRSERYLRNETELVILITPYLVNPISDRQMATPLDRLDQNAAWQADLTGPDPTDKGAALTNPETQHSSGFILK